jgi:hypothetical protein
MTVPRFFLPLLLSLSFRTLSQEQGQLQVQKRRDFCRFSARFQVLRAESGKQILSCARLDLKPAAPFAPVIAGGGRFFIRVVHAFYVARVATFNERQFS